MAGPAGEQTANPAVQAPRFGLSGVDRTRAIPGDAESACFETERVVNQHTCLFISWHSPEDWQLFYRQFYEVYLSTLFVGAAGDGVVSLVQPLSTFGDAGRRR
jgi:hypothetical protein